MLYYFIKNILYDRIGFCWNSKHLIKGKNWINHKLFNLFQKHKDSSHDEFVKDFKIVFLAIFLVSLISFYISSRYFNKSSAQGATIIWGMAYFLFLGFITKERFKALFDSIIKDLTRFLRKSINIIAILLAIAFTLGAIVSPNETIELFLTPSNLIVALSVTAIVVLINTFGLSLIFLTPYLLVAVFIILFREFVIKLTLKKSPDEPLKIISYIIADIVFIKGILANN